MWQEFLEWAVFSGDSCENCQLKNLLEWLEIDDFMVQWPNVLNFHEWYHCPKLVKLRMWLPIIRICHYRKLIYVYGTWNHGLKEKYYKRWTRLFYNGYIHIYETFFFLFLCACFHHSNKWNSNEYPLTMVKLLVNQNVRWTRMSLWMMYAAKICMKLVFHWDTKAKNTYTVCSH